jgi:hypothetical protein
MGDCFTSGVFYSGQVHGRFIDWDVFKLSCRLFCMATILNI